MRKTAPRWFCLFKLSDLGMFKSFPRFLLKRGFEITLHLNTDHFAINSSPVVGVPAAGQNHTTLKSLAALAGGYDWWVLYDGKCIVRSTQPDEWHLKIMLDALMAGDLTFPYYTWSMSKQAKCTQTNSVDCSYSGSWIDRTYFTFVNTNANTTADGKYEILAVNHQHDGGLRAFHDIQWCMVDIQGTKFPSADGLTDADVSLMKDYTEHYD